MSDDQSYHLYQRKFQEVIFLSFKIPHFNCCDLISTKTWIYTFIRIPNANRCPERKQAHFSFSSKDLQELHDQLAKYHYHKV